MTTSRRWVDLDAGAPLDEFGSKARRLADAAAAGLPVPAGYVLRHEAYDEARSSGWWTPDAGWHDADAAWTAWDLPQVAPRVAVRSAFGSEDDAEDSAAGRFTTRLDVDAHDRSALLAALHDVWCSAEGHDDTRRDVLVMRMVAAERAGVLFTEGEHELDLVDWTDGLADDLVAGRVAGRALELPKLRRLESGDASAPWERRLQRLARDVRRAAGAGDWDVEWADDGERCWLVQVRPITRAVVRDERFTMANHREILPDPPSPLMASLIGECADALFEGYRRFDPDLPSRRPFLEVFHGRPMINLSLLTDMMRQWGLPTSLVTSSIGGSDEVRGAGLRPLRWLARAPALLRLALAQSFAPRSARRTADALVARSTDVGATFAEAVATGRDVYVRLVHEMFLLTGAMSGPLAALARSGTLARHERGFATISSDLYRELDALRALAAERPSLREALARGEVPDDAEFAAAWRRHVERFGHRGVFESDLSRPRLREDPRPTLTSLAAEPIVRPPRGAASGSTLLTLVTRPLWWMARAPLAAREELRHRSMIAFDRVRARLLELADACVARGALRGRDDVWLLTVDEARRLDEGWTPTADDWTRIEARHEQHRARVVPDVATRTELARAVAAGPIDDDRDVYDGLVLAEGDVEGVAWVLHEPATELPDGFDPADTLLVARSVDAGWVATFGRVAGVAVEIGGMLSHGSIILREIGLPSITNVQGVTASIRTGDRVRLRASSGRLERVVDAA